ncbi:hypothetical protein [Rhizobium sp. BK176]|uniref:hypothetical protein n=1 Tax=Rhizobium sp. BK176 TaxID=2587071 RepID=UPI002168D4BD|nr:hypothetical protein [Rhizobium sp. BK176]MCS4089521.1 hypothetical protein [Rhizobium sp. BK176]
MTNQNQPAANAEASRQATHSALSMPASVKVLLQAVEEHEVFKREQGERLKACKELLTRYHKRVENLELENRRLNAKVSSLESDNGRLLRENENYLRTQQNVDAAIHLACGTFHDTVQFVADATRMTMPNVPTSLGIEETVLRAPQAQPELTLVRKQPVTSFQVSSEAIIQASGDIAPLETLKPLQPSAEPEVAVAAPAVDLDNIEAMTNEIDAMLALEFRDGFDLPSDEQAPAAEEETKAA